MWASLFFDSVRNGGVGAKIAVPGLYTLFAFHTILALWLIWRHRRRLGVTLALCILTAVWVQGAVFEGFMRVTNRWL